MKPKFTFKIIDGNLYEFDANGNMIHFKNSNGWEEWLDCDANGNMIHFKNSDGYEYWRDYDANGNEIHFKNSYVCEYWYDSKGNIITKEQFDKIHSKSSCAGKVVEIDGKKYKLTAIE